MSKPPKKSKKSQTTKKKKDTLNWPVPGFATATLYFDGPPDSFKGIFVTLMPGFQSGSRVSALIGDDITSDDIMEIDHFEQVWPELGKDRQFVRAIFVNRSQKKVKFELGFDFDSDDKPEQKYEYEIEKSSRLKDTIPVKLVS